MSVTPTKRHKIVVLDSGAGGLTIAREILATISGISLTYIADNAFFPYGNLTDQALSERLSFVVGDIVERIKPCIIVIACNTASTLALTALREAFPKQLFVGVVPAVKPASTQSQSGYIGVLATPRTVKQDYTQTLIDDHARECKVFLHGSDKLAHLAEQLLETKFTDSGLVCEELKTLLAMDSQGKIDTIVLACTHFPILIDSLKASVPANRRIDFIDSAKAIARRTAYLLETEFSGNLLVNIANQIKIESMHSDSELEAKVQKSYMAFLNQ